MKARFIAIALIILVMVLLIWKFTDSTETLQASQPNIISFEASAESAPKTKQVITPKKLHVRVTDAVDLLNETAVVKAADELSYLDVYRMKRQLQACEQVIYRITEDQAFDAVADFENRIEPLKAAHPSWPTQNQIRAVKKHASRCKRLLHQIEAFQAPKNKENQPPHRSSYLNLPAIIDQQLQKMTAETKQEKAIAQVLYLVDAWQAAFDEVLAHSKGDETQHADEIMALREDIRSLELEQSEMYQLRRENPALDFSGRFIEIWQEVQALKRKITDLSLVDASARNAALVDFEVLNDLLFEQLRSRDPDVFYEAQVAAEKSQYNRHNFGYMPHKNIGKGKYKVPFIEYISPGEVIKAMLGIDDDELFSLVINYATQLYHCELGADCTADGDWNLHLCHAGYNNLYEAACYLDLATFYQQHLLNENQWQDVQYVLSVIRGVYEG